MENTIQQLLQQAIANALDTLYGIKNTCNDIQLQNTRKDFKGDFTLVVFPYVKQARKKPEEVADEIGKAVCSICEAITSYNTVKGFLNFEVDNAYWCRFVSREAANEQFGMCKADGTKPPVVIEFSSPNTNKPLHLGHIRNNLLGWSVANLLSASGENVKRVNLVNDRGIHICKSMLAWQRYSGGETPESSGIKGDHLVGKYYVEFDKHFKQQTQELEAQGSSEDEAKHNAPLIVEAQDMLRRWEEGDKEVRELWEKMNQWVYDGFNETYRKLGISFDKIYYESNTYLLGKELVTKGLEMGVLFRKEDGSVWCDLTDEGLDQKLLLRKDGTSVYMTQDLGTALLRHKEFNAGQLIYVVGNEQDYHFKVLKKVLGRLGFDWADKVYHLSYGMVELPNGKMKSREGTVVDADDLIEGMVATARQMGEEHGRNNDLPQTEQEQLYLTLALGALKYFILKVDPVKNMLFNPEESIDFNGNTGPFIQYTYARIQSIVRKSDAAAFNGDKVEIGEKERDIITKLHDLPNAIQQAARNLSPAMVANYAYDLAKAFNSFYQDTPILKESDELKRSFRIQLSKDVGFAIKNTMYILGIDVPERM
ncbi:MAG: arginine--tRNA ligase [Bacteroidales bacterium]|nr:arginine--tRNA ligase [Bacteroidales bacterium]